MVIGAKEPGEIASQEPSRAIAHFRRNPRSEFFEKKMAICNDIFTFEFFLNIESYVSIFRKFFLFT